MNKNVTKQKVIHSASLLFFQKGFHATSVRDIAEKASVNVSLISYYFKSKQGLFEHAVTEYYEDYLSEMKVILENTKELNAKNKLKKLICFIMKFKQDNFYLTCTIQRELSLFSIFIKELTVTYVAKENHVISTLFFDFIKNNTRKSQNKDLLFIHLKGMLITPYVMHHEWRYQFTGKTSTDLFVKKYVHTIYDWIDSLTIDETVRSSVKRVK